MDCIPSSFAKGVSSFAEAKAVRRMLEHEANRAVILFLAPQLNLRQRRPSADFSGRTTHKPSLVCRRSSTNSPARRYPPPPGRGLSQPWSRRRSPIIPIFLQLDLGNLHNGTICGSGPDPPPGTPPSDCRNSVISGASPWKHHFLNPRSSPMTTSASASSRSIIYAS